VEPAAVPSDVPARAPSGTRGAWIAAAVGLVVAAAHLRWPSGTSGEVTYLAVNGGAGVLAVVGWQRVRDPVSRWIATGVVLSFLGDLVYQLQFWTGRGTEETSPADLGWVGSYVALIGALFLVLRRARDWLDVDAWVDVATVTLVALMLQWQVVLSSIISDAPSLLHAFVWALYPALDAVLVALVVRTVLARRVPVATALVLLGGAGCWLVSDLVYTLLAPSGVISGWLDAGWMVGALLLAVVAWQPPVGDVATEGSADEQLSDSQVGRGRIAVALVPLVVPSAVEVIGWFQGFNPNPLPLFVTAVGLLALAYLRFVRLAKASDGARRELRSRERRAQLLALHSSDAAVIVDGEGTILADSPALAALVGRHGTPTLGANLFDVVHVIGVEDLGERFGRILDTPGVVHESEVEVGHAGGHHIWLGVRAVNLLDDPAIGGVLVNVHDVTRRKEVEDELIHQAFHDALTGLANRQLFTDRVQQALQRTTRTGDDLAVIFLDLDGFKNVNDSLGHAAGDELLWEVAARLAQAVRESDTVARLGGDEFAVLLEQRRGPIEEAVIVADRILAALSSPILVDGHAMAVGASLGISVGSPGATAASLLRDADVAMYRAKASGRGRWVVHDADMRAEAAERLQLETDLLGALEGDELRLVYQPVIDLQTGEVESFEALLRWEHPELGLITPDRFVPIAEMNGMVLPIGAWVLQEACRQAATWRAQHPERTTLGVAVNVSARQVASPSLVDHVSDALQAAGLDPAHLTLELTESTLVEDPTVAAQRLTALRSLGIRLAIDDFGTGYSSLSYLRQFPLDILKIDRSFIGTISASDHLPAIVRGLLDLGHTLGLTTVAEGVELDLQREQLRAVGCDYAQGFLFARPLDVEAAGELLATSSGEVAVLDAV
jgi:diguanylate cyclase (GGDEF)-like protein/PAS domain S-box-containing protein